MDLRSFENMLHTKIPMTKYMNLSLESYDDQALITKAPLEENINDKGTAFGGSLSTIAIMSSWSMCNFILDEFNLSSENIVIINNTTNFTAPVTKELVCHTKKPTKEQLETLQNKLNTKRSGSIKIQASIIEDDNVCMEFEGVYVIKL